MKNVANIIGLVFCVLLIWIPAIKSRAQVVYFVSVDTTPLAGQAGSLDFQFNPGGADALNASVSITNFVADGNLAATSTNTGDVNGSLPGPPASLGNTTPYNDLSQGFTFGNKFSFYATFDGPALSPSPPFSISGTGLILSLYNSDNTANLLTTNPDGSILSIDIDQFGATSSTASVDANGVYRATATLIAPVPEASSVTSFGTGLAFLIVITLATRFRAKKKARPS